MKNPRMATAGGKKILFLRACLVVSLLTCFTVLLLTDNRSVPAKPVPTSPPQPFRFLVTQGEWAVYLVRTLRLEHLIARKKPIRTDDYMKALESRKGYQRYSLPESLQEIEGITITGDSQGNPLIVALKDKVLIPITVYLWKEGITKIRAKVMGDKQVWTIPKIGRFTVVPDSIDSPVWKDVETVRLPEKTCQMHIQLSKGSAVSEIEFIGSHLPAISPPGGFSPLKPLTYGDKAVTIVRALNLERRLPPDRTFILEMEIHEGGHITRPVTLPANGVYSIEASFHGRSGEHVWKIDTEKDKILLRTKDAEKPYWNGIATRDFSQGKHTIEASLSPGTVVDQLRITKRITGQKHYLKILADVGFFEGPPRTLVPRERAVHNAAVTKKILDEAEALDAGKEEPLTTTLEPHRKRGEEEEILPVDGSGNGGHEDPVSPP